jgi:hypothetical protein
MDDQVALLCESMEVQKNKGFCSLYGGYVVSNRNLMTEDP